MHGKAMWGRSEIELLVHDAVLEDSADVGFQECAGLRGCTPFSKSGVARAVAGKRVEKILDAVSAAGAEHRRRISTATLNMVLRETLNWRAPPSSRGSTKKGRIYYATQVMT